MINNVNEPQKCVYSYDFYTPAVCQLPSSVLVTSLGVTESDIESIIMQHENENMHDEL